MNFKKVLFEIFVILFLSVTIGLFFNEARDNPLDIIGDYSSDNRNTEQADSVYEEKYITADELFYYLSKGEAIIFDARDYEYYKEGHIPFAISLPVRKFDEIFDNVKGILNGSKIIIIYCSGANCIDSADLGWKLYRMGYSNIFIYKGGISEWKDELQNRVEIEEK